MNSSVSTPVQVNLIVEAMRNPKYSGVVNGTAPAPVRFGDFCAEVAKAANRPNLLPVPGFVVRLLLGEGATVVLDGQKVLPKCAFFFSSLYDCFRAPDRPRQGRLEVTNEQSAGSICKFGLALKSLVAWRPVKCSTGTELYQV